MGRDLIALIKEKQDQIAKLQTELDEARALLDGRSLARPVGESHRFQTRQPNQGRNPLSYKADSAAGRAVAVLREAKIPLHVNDLIARIERNGYKVVRSTLVGNLSRWAKKKVLFYRARPNTFGLLEWKEGKIGRS